MSYQKTLNDNRQYLLENLELEPLLPRLRTDDFSTSDAQKISSKDTDEEKIDIFVDILLEKNKGTYDEFMYIIKDKQNFIFNHLNTTKSPRQRRVSISSIGNIMIEGGVPKLPSSYIPRTNLENALRSRIIESKDKNAPLLLCGGLGTGKRNLLISALKHEEIMHSFPKICWFTVGKVTDVKHKLMSLFCKLNEKDYLQYKNEPIEIFKEKIEKYLRNNSILLVLADVKNEKVMKDFTFNSFFIVISHNNGLLDSRRLENTPFVVPEEFTQEECRSYMKHFENKLNGKEDALIKASHKNPAYLELIIFKIIDNPAWIGKLDQMLEMDEIIEEYLNDSKCLSNKHDQSFDLDWMVVFDKGEWFTEIFMTSMWKNDQSSSNHNFECTEKLRKQNVLVERVDTQLMQNVYSLKSIFYENLSKSSERRSNYKDVVDKIYQKSMETKPGDWFDHSNIEKFITFFRCLPNLIDVMKDHREFSQKLIDFYSNFEFLASKIMFCSQYDLLSDYAELDLNKNPFKEFVKQNAFTGIDNAEYLFIYLLQLALCDETSSHVYKKALETIKLRKLKFPFYRWYNYQRSFKNWEISHTHKIDLIDVKKHKVIVASENSGCVSILSKNGCDKQMKVTNKKIISCHFSKNEDYFYIVDSDGFIKKFGENDLTSKMSRMSIGDVTDSLTTESKIEEFTSDDLVYYCDDNFLVFRKIITNNELTNKLSIHIYDKHGELKINHSDHIEDQKKIIPISDGVEFFIYVLHSLSEISVFNEFEKLDFKPFSPETSDCVVNDFIVCRHTYDQSLAGLEVFTIYVAVANTIYKNSQKLFSLNTGENITSLAINSKLTQIAIVVNNERTELWDTTIPTFQGVIKGTSMGFGSIQYICDDPSMYDDSFDDEGDDYNPSNDTEDLLSVTNNTIKSWTIANIDKTPCSPSINQCLSTYESKIYINPSKSFIILQRIDKSLKKMNLPLVEDTLQIQEHIPFMCTSKALCYGVAGNWIFISFADKNIKICSEKPFTCKKTITESSAVLDLSVLSLKDGRILLVYYGADNTIHCLKFESDLSTSSELESFSNCSFVKFFNNNQRLILCYISGEQLNLKAYNDECNFSVILEKNINANTLVDCDINRKLDYFISILPDNHMQIDVFNHSPVKDIEHHCFNNYKWLLCKFGTKIYPNRSIVAALRQSDQASESRVYLISIDKEHKVNLVSKILIESLNNDSSHLIGKVNTLVWSNCGMFVWLVADCLVRLSIKNEVEDKGKQLKRQRTLNNDIRSIINKRPVILKTLFGNCQNLYLVGEKDSPYTIDHQGYLYVFEQIDVNAI